MKREEEILKIILQEYENKVWFPWMNREIIEEMIKRTIKITKSDYSLEVNQAP